LYTPRRHGRAALSPRECEIEPAFVTRVHEVLLLILIRLLIVLLIVIILLILLFFGRGHVNVVR
jgi:hypothetical protein